MPQREAARILQDASRRRTPRPTTKEEILLVQSTRRADSSSAAPPLTSANTADSVGVSTSHAYAPGRPAVLENPTWFEDTWALIEARAAQPGLWTADDLRELGATEPNHPNHWGSMFRKAQAAGIIAQAGFVASRRKKRHGGAVRVWVGTTFQGEAAA